MALDGARHGAGMRGEQQAGQMHMVRIQPEFGAHRGPVRPPVRTAEYPRLCRHRIGEGQGSAAQGGAGRTRREQAAPGAVNRLVLSHGA